MTKEVELVISGIHPAPWQAPLISRRGGCSYRGKSDRQAGWLNYPDWKREVAKHARVAMGNRPLLLAPLRIHMEFVFQSPNEGMLGDFAFLPMRWNKKEKKWAKPVLQRRTLPDTTNMFKAAEDALQGVVFADDYQVVSESCARTWGRHGGCIIKVYSIDAPATTAK